MYASLGIFQLVGVHACVLVRACVCACVRRCMCVCVFLIK